ncbi:MAG TPA: radical SAM protein, partial [Ktedonobacterales bacterium]
AGYALATNDLIPLPDGATLSMLPGRLAVGLDADGVRQSVPESEGWALAALLPVGYTRTNLPGYDLAPQAKPLPFFGYSAVVGVGEALFVAATQTDDPGPWHPRHFAPARVKRVVRQRLREEPENAVLRHHAHCALDYGCPTATNLFLRREEGAVAVSAGCNARCVGCISKQDEDGLVSPQDRLTFLPPVADIVSTGVAHLSLGRRAIYSFGQGCEGEPILQARLIEEAIRGMRAQTQQGTININTNASDPAAMARLYAAGLDSVRVSTISARPATYTAYYRPIGYTYEDVRQSLLLARDAGIYSSINLLCFPGLIDCEDEVDALVMLLREAGVRLVQLRNLNIDPEVLWRKVRRPDGAPMGMRAFIETLRREVPQAAIGNYSRAVGQPAQERDAEPMA